MMPKAVVVGVALTAGFMISMVGCSDDGDPSGSPSVAGTSGEQPFKCPTYQSCTCPNGTISRITCEGEVESCDCAACAEFSPNPPPLPFDACGGEPFGTWHMTDHDTSGMALQIAVSDPDVPASGACPTDLEEHAPPNLRLALEDGGGASVVFTGYSMTARVLESCVLEHRNRGCEILPNCGAVGCGTCSCSLPMDAVLDPSASWTRVGTTLNVGRRSYDYCVDGDVMRLHDQSNNALFTLERRITFGTPAPCSQRTSETCESAGDCHLGVCSGDAGCAAATSEANCTNQQGCSWSPTGCDGQSAGSCAVEDYAIVPGCEAVEVSGCVGIPEPCSNHQTQEACVTQVGCSAGGGCFGIAVEACDYVVDSCASCPGGCTCSAGLNCEGEATCADQTTLGECQFLHCEWHTFGACSGASPPCEALSPDQCTTVPGCAPGPP